VDLRLFVVEPDGLRRRLICEEAQKASELTLIGNGASLGELPSTPKPDIVLVAASALVDEPSEAVALSERFPSARLVLIGSHPDLEALLGALHLPIRGYLSFNHLSGDEFLASLKAIAYGGAVIEPLATQMLLEYLQGLRPMTRQTASASPLTKREEQVLELVRKGLSNKQIGAAMRISLGTVRAHLRTIFRKLDVTSRAGAAAARSRT
jgi:DNA-binding NarL/FixJ family response regulator